MASKAVQGFIDSNPVFENMPGLPEASRNSLEAFLKSNKSHDPEVRLAALANASADGTLIGFKFPLPPYLPKGKGSWKHLATGIEGADDGTAKPQWSQAFETSDYRKFHDAIKQHRFVVTQEILPNYGVRLA